MCLAQGRAFLPPFDDMRHSEGQSVLEAYADTQSRGRIDEQTGIATWDSAEMLQRRARNSYSTQM